MITFTIPLEVPSQNVRERQHWAVQRREVKRWAAHCRALAPLNSRAETKRQLYIIAYRRRLIADYANLVGGCKGLIDGLVAAGLLVDDSTAWVSVLYAQHLASRSPLGRGKVCAVIEIENITEKKP